MTDFMSVPNADCDLVLKVIMVGNAGVGKSCLLKAFKGDTFDMSYTSTIGVDFEIKSVVAHGKTVNLQIWDTAGQERFRTITTSYYRSSDAILLVYDITHAQSFLNLEDWMADVRMYAKPNVDIMLVGNKADLESKREVDFKKAKEYADRHKMLFMETSAKAGSNVETAFTRLTMSAVQTKLNEIADKKRKEDMGGTGSTSGRPSSARLPSGHQPVALGEQPTRDDGGSCSC